jgi:hypothetical protein
MEPKLDSVEASDGVDGTVTPPVIIGRGRGTGRGRGRGRGRVRRGVFVPALESLDEDNSSDENTTEDKSGTKDNSEDPPNTQGGSRSPPANSVTTSDNDEGIQFPPVITLLVGLSATSNTAISTLPAPPEPTVVRSRSGRPIRAPVR